MVLCITLSRETRVRDKSPVMFVLATVYRPPGHHTDFIKEFADFLSELVLAADKVLIVGDFNIHVDNEKDALGSAFIDILNSIGVRQHVSGPTHCRNHTLDLILSHGIDVSGVEILQQSDDISDHYLVLCKLHIAKTVNSTPCYKYGRTITSSTKDCFVSNLPDLSQFLSISNSSEQLDDVTETMDSLFSSTLDTVAPLRLRKIKEKSPTPWYNEHTRTLKHLFFGTQRRRSHFFSPRPLPYFPCLLSCLVTSHLLRDSLCIALQKIMDLINWSLNAIDTIFSTRSLGSGEPDCPDGTFAAGYTMDAWERWRIVCLAALSVEDIEDIYLFGTMITGLLLIGVGFALGYRRIQKTGTAVQSLTRLPVMIEAVGRAVSIETETINRNMDSIMEKLTALQRKIDGIGDQNGQRE